MICDFLLALPEQLGRHLGINYAEVIANVLTEYNIIKRIGFFVTDNAGNNDTCLEQLAIEFGFDKKERRLCCAPHILNRVAQSTLFGSDKEVFSNEDNITVYQLD